MVLPAVKEQILSDLERLTPEQQERAAELIHGLVLPLPPGVPGRKLLHFVGAFDKASVQEMKEAIEAGCNRVDLDGW